MASYPNCRECGNDLTTSEEEEQELCFECQDSWLVRCRCGWVGLDSELVSGYVWCGDGDVEPMYKCPVCGRTEDTCEWERRQDERAYE